MIKFILSFYCDGLIYLNRGMFCKLLICNLVEKNIMKEPILFRNQLRGVSDSIQKEKEEKLLYTGRYLMTLDNNEDFSKIGRQLQSKLGLRMASSSEYENGVANESQLGDADVLMIDELGIALISGDDNQMKALNSQSGNFILEPERIVYLPDNLVANGVQSSTWGMDVTKTINSNYSGKNIKVAVLDTGFDFNHSDFYGRNVVSHSFVNGEQAQDGHGHGTHCIGSACGNVDQFGLRYGVAKDSDIFVGKVLSNAGRGAQAWSLMGIKWAVNQGCKVISMSLGSSVFPGQGYDHAYERVAKDALKNGSVIVAAAGNDSKRSRQLYNPINSPANSPSVLSVGSVNVNLRISDFSNRGINPNQNIDFVSPGEEIYSSWLMPKRNRSISGTSMATPHVAGILALLWERNPNASAYQIIHELRTLSKRLPLSSMDVGAGLTIAP